MNKIMIKTPNFWLTKNFISNLLLPLSFVYQIIFFFKKKFAKKRVVKIPVICIGNIVAGGAGKTPVAIEIGKILNIENIKFCYLVRGYKRKNSSEILYISKPNQMTAEITGDETLLLAEISPVVVSKNRFLGYQKIFSQNKFKLIVMDDGLQNFQINYDLKILVVDSKIGFGNHRLMPAGPLRQNLKNIANEIDFFIIIGEKNVLIEQEIKQLNAHAKILPATIKAENISQFQNQKIFAFCGIAYPSKFFEFLKSNNVNIEKHQAFKDHHFYSENELNKLIEEAKQNNLTLLTTKKDWIKFPKKFQDEISFLDINLEIENKHLIKNFINNIIHEI